MSENEKIKRKKLFRKNKIINLYGQEKGDTWEEEIANFVSHTVGAGLSILGFVLLTIKGAWSRDIPTLLSFMIFGLGLIVLYTMSAIYHGLIPGTAKRVFEIFDHSAIYILIAASYTPFLVLVVKSTAGNIILWIQWIICFLGILFKSFFTGKFKGFSTILYLIMGWMIVFSWSSLRASINDVSLIFLIIGGLLYSLGTIFYMWKLFKYHHMVWHLFVLFGSIAHFFAVFFII